MPQAWKASEAASAPQGAMHKHYAQAIGARKRAPCILSHLYLIQISCENAWQKLRPGVCYVSRKQRRCTYVLLHVEAREERLASHLKLQEYLYGFRSEVCDKTVL